MNTALSIETDPAANRPLPIIVTDAGVEVHRLRLLLREAVQLLSEPHLHSPQQRIGLSERIQRVLGGGDKEIHSCWGPEDDTPNEGEPSR